MTFDAKSLLTAPLPTDLTVDGLAAALAQLQAAGMGGAGVKLPGGAPIRKINLVAHGEQAAHFILTDGAPKGERVVVG
jgi:hypothetical protein